MVLLCTDLQTILYSRLICVKYYGIIFNTEKTSPQPKGFIANFYSIQLQDSVSKSTKHSVQAFYRESSDLFTLHHDLSVGGNKDEQEL